MGSNSSNIINFSQIDMYDLDLIGEKANEISQLKNLGIPIPDGFVILPNFNLSESLVKEIHDAYKKLSSVFKETSLNIISSPSSNSKFIIFKNVKGDANLIMKIKEIYKFHSGKPVAIVVQKNIQSKIKGKITTNNPTKELEHLAKKIKKHFYFPQEIEYCIEKSKIFVTQVMPFTGVVREFAKNEQLLDNFRKAIIKGISVNPGIVTGSVKLVSRNFVDVKKSEIAVIKNLNNALFNKIKLARGIVAETFLHSSIDKLNYRKMIKSPTIAGAQNSTKLLRNGDVVTINGATGEIYSGGLIY